VLGQLEDNLDFPGYQQESWVSVQRYADAPWEELVALWQNYNLTASSRRLSYHRFGLIIKCTLLQLKVGLVHFSKRRKVRIPVFVFLSD